jgi:hypothetical protein
VVVIAVVTLVETWIYGLCDRLASWFSIDDDDADDPPASTRS